MPEPIRISVSGIEQTVLAVEAQSNTLIDIYVEGVPLYALERLTPSSLWAVFHKWDTQKKYPLLHGRYRHDLFEQIGMGYVPGVGACYAGAVALCPDCGRFMPADANGNIVPHTLVSGPRCGPATEKLTEELDDEQR